MAEPTDTEALQTLDGLNESSRVSLAAIADNATRIRAQLDLTLLTAPSIETHLRAQLMLRSLAEESERATARIRSLADHADRLREEWEVAHRYSEEGLASLGEQIRMPTGRDAHARAREWLRSLLDAAEAGEWKAVSAIATMRRTWPKQLQGGAKQLRDSFRQWSRGGRGADLEAIERLARGDLDGWQTVPTPDIVCRLHRFAAWAVLRSSGQASVARRHMDEAVEASRNVGRMYAERANLSLFVGDFEQAATDAQRAIEVSPREAFGYLALGMWAELGGDFSGADDLYRRGFGVLTPAAIARFPLRSALIDPTGRVLGVAASVLLERGHPQEALGLADQALQSGVRGIEAHPEARVHLVRHHALELLGDPSMAASAALAAGRLCVMNGDIDCAIEELEYADKLDPNDEAGWLLADAFLTKSFPLGARLPDPAFVERSRQTWESTEERSGWPRPPYSWAYLTRAILSDLESQRPEADRRAGLCEALMYVEKALVHGQTDAQRWGYAAQFLRYLGLDELAHEAADAGFGLAPADRQVLAERLVSLAQRGDFTEAEAVAETMIAMYGEDPLVTAVRASLALYSRHYETTLDLLHLPLEQGNDQAWYREMQALAYLGLGRIEEAHESYRAILGAPPIDGNTKCRLARASVALARRSAARRWSTAARKDPTTRQASYLTTIALEAAGEGDMENCAKHLAAAIRSASRQVEADSVVFETGLALRGLPPGDASNLDEMLRAATRIATDQKRRLKADPVTGDGELQMALGESGDLPDIERTALMAVAARREVAAGEFGSAMERYQRLVDSRFEPEATIALRMLQLPRESPDATDRNSTP